MSTDGNFVRFDCDVDPDDAIVVFLGSQADGDLMIEVREGHATSAAFLSNDDARELARRILSHLPPQSDA